MKRQISESNSLSNFRKYWTPDRILDLIGASGGKLLVNWPIGVGKSFNLDGLIEVATRSGRYDLVVVLLPTRAVLNERRWIKDPPRDINIVNLRPRPEELCGEDTHKQWKILERQGMGLLGRKLLCRPCPHYTNCFWPGQYGRGLKDAQVVFATQSHVERDPTFIFQVRLWRKARRVLTILDEVNFISKSSRRSIKREHLRVFAEILEKTVNAN